MPDSVVDRILYASLSRVEGPVFREMEQIRAAALRHNPPLGIHTALLYQSGWFLQWKEGPRASVESVMGRVAADRRHHSLRIVHHSRGPRLLPEPWSMAIVQTAEKATDFARRVMGLRDELAQGFQYSPATVWRRLSTPMQHLGAAQQQDPELFHRVMVVSARAAESFSLVAWLAAQSGEEVVHRRFAGALDLDVGSDYVDFVDGERVMRVIAMARNGLMLGLTRAFVPDYAHMVLMFSGDQRRDADLLERVMGACTGQPHVPVVVGVGAAPGESDALFEQARRSGLIYIDAGAADVYEPESVWACVQPVLQQGRLVAASRWPTMAGGMYALS